MRVSKADEEEISVFIDQMVEWFCVSPSATKIKYLHGANSSIVEIHTANENIGCLIGKKGVIVSAIRTLISGYFRRLKRGCQVEIVKSEPKRRRNLENDNNSDEHDSGPELLQEDSGTSETS